MRRWTVLLIPHDTDEPRTIAVSARAMRAASVALVVVGVSALVGVASLAQRIAAPDDDQRTRRPSAGATAQSSPEAATPADRQNSAVDSLRATIQALYGALDTIRQVDRRLSEVAGLAPTDSTAMETRAALLGTRATADSLLLDATLVAGQLEALADSAQTSPSFRGLESRASQSGASRAGEKK